MQKYKISMIIPTYNCKNEIERAIKSIIKQTIGFKNIELILVDDNSNDGTKDILKEYSAKYDNIKSILLNENSGSAGKPRNIGIKNATGDYLMFLDNDDTYQEHACEILYDKISKNNHNVAVCNNTREVYNKNDLKNEEYISPKWEIKNIKKDPNYLFNIYYPSAVWNKIYNRKFIIENNIRCLEGLPEDNYFTYQCYLLEENILFLKNLNLYNHYFYRINSMTVTSQCKPEYLIKSFKVFIILVNLIQSYKNNEKFLNTFVNFYLNTLIPEIFRTNASKSQKYQLFDLLKNEGRKFSNTLNFKFFVYSLFYKLILNNHYLIGYYYSSIFKILLNIIIKIRKENNNLFIFLKSVTQYFKKEAY